MPQYAAILSPQKVEKERVIEILRKHNFDLISNSPITNYDGRDICMNLFVDFKTYSTILGSYEVYRVVGPDPYRRRPLFKFHNTPFWTKLHYYSTVSFRTAVGLVRYYLTKRNERATQA